MPDHVFVSYSNHDAPIASAICAALEGMGLACWIAPRDIRPSSDWAEQIIDGINAASVMVMVFSSASNKSPQVRREVERAVNRDMPVVPFRIERVMPAKSLEYFLSTQHWFDAYEGDPAVHVAKLCDLVATIAKPRGEPSPPSSNGGAPFTATDLTATFSMPPAPATRPAYRDEDLAFLARELAREIGPIARYLVQRASAAAATPVALVETLATEVHDAKARTRFTAACRQRLGI